MNPHQPFPYPADHLGDYKDAVWLPGRDLLAGRDPYDSIGFARAHPATQGYSPYTPSHLLVAALFAPLTWSVGAAVWTAVSTAAITIMGLITGRRLVEVAGWDTIARARVAGAGLGVIGAWVWRPDAMAIGLGQPTSIYGPVAALVGVMVLSPHPRAEAPDDGGASRPAWARGAVPVGLWTALSLSKPQVGLQAVLNLVSVRRWWALGVAVVTTTLGSLIVAAALAGGPTHLGTWLVSLPGHLRSAPSRFAVPGDNPWVDVSATTYRAGLRHGPSTLIGPLLAVGLVSGAFVAARRLRRTGRAWLGGLTLTLGGLAALPHAGYDALLLYPMVVLAAAEAWRTARPTPQPASTHPAKAAEPGTSRSWWVGATVVLSVAIGAVPNRIPLVRVEPGAVVGVLVLLALACAITAATSARPSRPGTAQFRAARSHPLI